MILASALAVRAGEGDTPLTGNAKVYDGAFDYDIISSFPEINTSFSVLLSFFIDQTPATNKILLDLRDIVTDLSFVFLAESAGTFRSQYGGAAQSRANIVTGKIVVIVNMSTSQNKIYINGSNATISEGIPASINATIRTVDVTIGDLIRNAGGTFNFDGVIKNIEILNRVATVGEISQASAGGSFTEAGISYGSGSYYLAVDFDKTNGNPPTTFAGTPAYTITSFGGAEYVDYPSL